MLLRNVSIPGDAEKQPKDILVENSSIRAVLPAGTTVEEADVVYPFTDAIAFPGLINSHEHLEFNLFPKTGNRIYANYREWGDDIHSQNQQTIREVLQVPLSLRIQWGMYKNLLNGFTTVVNHGDPLPVTNPFITVHQAANTIHSVGFEKKWKWKLNHPRWNRQVFAIHIGEGTDAVAAEEIDTLLRWNVFNRPLVGIHAVAMKPAQARCFKALVWCPESNYFLLNRTAAMDVLQKETTILFGTDSTLTADWNAWPQFRMARETRMLSDQKLIEGLTLHAARIWNMGSVGILRENQRADMVVARRNGRADLYDAFYAVNPEDILLVVKNGKIVLIDEEILQQQTHAGNITDGMSEIYLNKTRKYITGNLPKLVQEIRAYYPAADFSMIRKELV
ncbi:MAG: amidohydrolase family protein [Bacteroidota bacterium]